MVVSPPKITTNIFTSLGEFSYKVGFVFRISLEILDLSCKMDLEILGLFWKGKILSNKQINMVVQKNSKTRKRKTIIANIIYIKYRQFLLAQSRNLFQTNNI